MFLSPEPQRLDPNLVHLKSYDLAKEQLCGICDLLSSAGTVSSITCFLHWGAEA